MEITASPEPSITPEPTIILEWKIGQALVTDSYEITLDSINYGEKIVLGNKEMLVNLPDGCIYLNIVTTVKK